MKESLSFDDILLEPIFSTVRSRSEVDLSVSFPKGFQFQSPIIPANMKDLVGIDMILTMKKFGALTLLHRFDSLDTQIRILNWCLDVYPNLFDFVGVSIGVKESDKDNLKAFVDLGVKIVCIDIAHLDSVQGMEMVNWVSQTFPHLLLIAGNVSTGKAAERAWLNGADVVKVGIGSSGICSTRLETGAGVPQMSAIIEVREAKLRLEETHLGIRKIGGRQIAFISDGGARKAGDIVKALCFADMVMLGGMLSGSSATPGEEREINGEIFKSYAGSSTHKSNRIEGVKGLVKSKGPTEKIIQRIHEGIQSGCSYQNARNLNELKDDPQIIRITGSGIVESSIHDVLVLEEK